MKDKIKEVYEQKVTVPNVGGVTILSASDHVATQDIPYHQIQMLYITDYVLVQQQSPFTNILTCYIDEDTRRIVNDTSF
jgi:hypothetical protein